MDMAYMKKLDRQGFLIAGIHLLVFINLGLELALL